MEVVILRPPLVYGPGVKANFLKLLKLTHKGLPLPFKKIHNRRSYIYIDNLVSAICVVIESPKSANQLYLVSDDESWSLASILSFLGKEMNVNTRLFSVPVNLLIFVFNLLGLRSLNARLFGSLEVSNDKIKSELDWYPPVISNDGLSKTVQWYKSEYGSRKSS